MVSATSTGCPPWNSEFIGRPHLAVANGIASVIFGLDEPRCRVDGDVLLASTGLSACGSPIMPALVGVVRLAAVARDAGHRRQADDAATVADHTVADEALGEALRRSRLTAITASHLASSMLARAACRG